MSRAQASEAPQQRVAGPFRRFDLRMLGLAVVAAVALAGVVRPRVSPDATGRHRRWERSAARIASGAGWALVAVYCVLAYVLSHHVFARISGPSTNFYVLQPLAWGGLALLSAALLAGLRERARMSGQVIALAALAASFQIALLATAGILFGFGHSPYARQPVHMLENALYIGSFTAGIEFSRAYMLARCCKRLPSVTLPAMSVLYALILVSPGQWGLLHDTRSILQFTGGTILPALSLSLLASYLAYHCGVAPALLYRGGIVAFEWFTPILPDLDWTVSAFVETVGPLMALLATREALTAPGERRGDTKDVSARWIVAALAIVALLWFNTGLFGVQPAVVSGVSMEPTYKTGDLLIIRPVDPDDVETGDVIRFRKGSIYVVHRVLDVEDTKDGPVFVTKGDNNNTPDEPILAYQVEGKVAARVPKAGWLPILIGKVASELQ